MMASACVNNPTTDHAFGWLSPRVSFSRDSDPNPKPAKSSPVLVDPVSDPDFIDFEFRLHDPVAAMLPADELFSGGKLVPLHLSKPPPPAAAAAPAATLKPSRRDELIGSGSVSASDIFAVSPKAPTCTSRWRELLRIKRQQQQQQQQSSPKADPGGKNPNLNPTRSSALKQFLHRRSSLTDPNLGHPLLRESEPDALSRLSLSSSTSSDTNEFPRHSLDSDLKPNPHPILLNRNPPRARLSSAAGGGRVGRSPARRPAEAPPPARCASVDSPRMNASGRVVFQGLGRSSSSPSTFNGGPNAAARNKYKGMERSYSANVRVINVPVPSKAGSVFGFLGPKNAAATGGNRGKKTRDDVMLSHY